MQVFSNNGATVLASPLSAIATTMTVASSASFAPREEWDVELVTLDSGTAREIVAVTERDGNVWMIERGQEGTTPGAWASGVKVEGRLTAGALARMPISAPDGDPVGVDSVSIQPSRSSGGQVASGHDAVAIGSRSTAAGDRSVAIGYLPEAFGARSIALGQAYTEPDASDAVAIGKYAYSGGEGAICIGGDAATGWNQPGTVALGQSANAGGANSAAIGKSSAASATGSVAIGGNARATDPYCLHLSALPRHLSTSQMGSDGTDRAYRTARQSATPVTLMTELLALQTPNAAITLTIPPNTRFFCDSAGIIITAASSPAGTPQVAISNGIMAAADVTAATAWARQVWPAINSGGVTGDLIVSVATALTSGTASARVYLVGMLVQV